VIKDKKPLMKVYFQIGILFLLILGGCNAPKENIKTPQKFKKMVLTVYSPVLPPDQICITETFEIEENSLQYTQSESLCGENKPTKQNKQINLSPEKKTEIVKLLAKLKVNQFSNDSRYDGNSPISLQIEWENLKEIFSFLYYEGKEITELYAMLQTIVK